MNDTDILCEFPRCEEVATTEATRPGGMTLYACVEHYAGLAFPNWSVWEVQVERTRTEVYRVEGPTPAYARAAALDEAEGPNLDEDIGVLRVRGVRDVTEETQS